MKAKGWLETVKHPFKTAFRVVQEFLNDDGPFIAAGIAFYAFFSLFPLVLISVALLSYLYTPTEAITATIGLTSMFLPQDMVDFLDEHVRELFDSSGRIGLTGLLILLWSGRQLFRAMELSLHRAWNIPVERNWVAGNLLCMMLVLLCTAVVLAVGASSVALNWVRVKKETMSLPEILERSWVWADAHILVNIHSWIVVPFAVALMFLLLYIILPSRQVPISMAVPGAIFSAMAWKMSTWVYLTYLLELGSQNPFYGTIWGIVGLLVWLYIEASVFILGAELVFVNLDSSETAILGTSKTKRKQR